MAIAHSRFTALLPESDAQTGLAAVESELFQACDKGDPVLLDSCLARGLFHRCVDGDDLYSMPLIRAAWSGSAECVRLLLAHSIIDPSALRSAGITALMIAVVQDNVEMVEALAPVCDFFQKDATGCSAVEFAAERGSRECVEAILAHMPWKTSAFSAFTRGIAARAIFSKDMPGTRRKNLAWLAGRLLRDIHPLSAARERALRKGHTGIAELLESHMLARQEERELSALKHPAAKPRKANRL